MCWSKLFSRRKNYTVEMDETVPLIAAMKANSDPEPLVASGDENTGAYLAFDGKANTHWTSGDNPANPAWVRIDLGEKKLVGGFQFQFQGAGFPVFQIQGSNDGAEWVEVAAGGFTWSREQAFLTHVPAHASVVGTFTEAGTYNDKPYYSRSGVYLSYHDGWWAFRLNGPNQAAAWIKQAAGGNAPGLYNAVVSANPNIYGQVLVSTAGANMAVADAPVHPAGIYGDGYELVAWGSGHAIFTVKPAQDYFLGYDGLEEKNTIREGAIYKVMFKSRTARALNGDVLFGVEAEGFSGCLSVSAQEPEAVNTGDVALEEPSEYQHFRLHASEKWLNSIVVQTFQLYGTKRVSIWTRLFT